MLGNNPQHYFIFFKGDIIMIKGIKGMNIEKEVRFTNELFIVNRICNKIVQDLIIEEIND